MSYRKTASNRPTEQPGGTTEEGATDRTHTGTKPSPGTLCKRLVARHDPTGVVPAVGPDGVATEANAAAAAAAPIVASIRDADGRLVYVNDRCLEILNCADDQVEITDPHVWPERTESELSTRDREVLATGSDQQLLETVASANGEVRDWLVNLCSLRHSEGQRLIGRIAVDVSEYQRTARKLWRLNRFYQILCAANEAIVRTKDKRTLLEAICKILVARGSFVMAWIGMVDHESGWVEPAVSAGFCNDYLSSIRICLDETQLSFDSPLRKLVDGYPLVTPNIEDESDELIARRVEALQCGYRSSACFPLRLGSKTIGLIGLYASVPGHFEQDEVDLLERLAENVAFALNVFKQKEARRKAEAELTLWAHFEPETGLLKRETFREQTSASVDIASRIGSSVSVLVVGLDRFAEISNVLGHTNGDALVRDVADLICQKVGVSHTLARLREDSLGILLPTVETRSEAEEVAIGVMRAVENKQFVVGTVPLQVRTRVGIALCPLDGNDADTVIRRAEIALDTSRRKHIALSFFERDDEFRPDRLMLASELHQALIGGSLELHYQPKISLRAGTTVGVEALLRWRHPTRGMVPPDEFVHLAEQTGLIHELTPWVLDSAIAQCARWRMQGVPLRVAINLSPMDLHDPNMVEIVCDLLTVHQVRPSWITLELTEGTVMESRAEIIQSLAMFHSMGIAISIDDFGTGYSSLAYLSRLPITQIKVDRSFVTRMVDNAHDRLIVQSVIDLGHNLGLEVTAEGVETDACLQELRKLGCDVVQGYGVGRPVSPEMLIQWLHQSPWQLDTSLS